MGDVSKDYRRVIIIPVFKSRYERAKGITHNRAEIQ